MSYVLRDDQMKAVNDVRHAMRSHQSVLLNAACGFGKSVVAGYVAQGVESKQKRVIFAVHRKELLKQTANTFAEFGIRFGYIASGMPTNPYANVQIASADTLRSRLHLLSDCDLLVPDEAHLWGNGQTRLNIIAAARDAGSKILPLTATPQCGNGKGLREIADIIVEGPPTSWLIEQGFLARFKAYAPRVPDLAGLHVRQGEYITSELDERFDNPVVVGDRVATYLQFATGKRLIGYCYSRDNGVKTAEAFKAAGIRAAFIDGETPDHIRRQRIEEFADGITPVLLNCQLFREGFDLSAQVMRKVPIQAVGLYAPTKSLPLAVQMMMRPMRPQDGYAVIIDHSNILKDHGLPDDERQWSLDGNGNGNGGGATPTTTCEKCSYTYRSALGKCPDCGHSPQPGEGGGRQVEEIDGEIVEVDVEAIRAQRKQEIRMARDLDSLAMVAVQRNYKPGWIINMMKARGDPPPTYQTAARAIQEARR